MADIDSLEVKIAADAEKASQSIDKLVKKLDSVAKSLGSINTKAMSASINELAGKLSAINGKGFNNLNKSAKEAENTIKKVSNEAKKGITSKVSFDTSDYETVIDRLSNKFSEAGKSFKPEGNLTQLEKQAERLSARPETLVQKEEQIGEIQQTTTPKVVNIPASPMGYDPKAVEEVEAIYQKMYGEGEKAEQKTDSLGNKVEELKEKLKELKEQGLNFGDAKFDEAYKQLNTASDELKKYKANLDQTGNSGKSFSEKVKSALSNLENKTSKTGTSVNKLTSSVKKMFSAMKSSSVGVKGLARNMGLLYVKFRAVVGAIKGFGKMVGFAQDYIEEFNYFSVALDKIGKDSANQFKEAGYGSAEEYAKSFRGRFSKLQKQMTGYDVDYETGNATSGITKSLGLDLSEIMQSNAAIAQITNSAGMLGETSIMASKAISMLSADWSSLANQQYSDVFNNMRSALTGQARAVYKYGIDITNAGLAQTAMNHGIKANINSLSQQSKMQLRVLTILEQSKVAYGDLARTINQPANQLRMLQAGFKKLAMTIGSIFMPIIQKVYPYLNAVVMVLQDFAEWIAKLTGAKLGDVDGGISTPDYSDAVDDTDTMADNMDKTAKKAKKAVDNLQGFDIINKLQDADSDKDTDTDKGKNQNIDLSKDISSALKNYENIWDKAFKDSKNKAVQLANDIKKAFGDIAKAAKPTTDAIKKLWNEGLSKLGKFSFNNLLNFWNNFLKPIGKWMLGDDSGLPRFFKITNDILNEIDWERLEKYLASFYTALQKPTKFVWTALMDFYEEFLKPIAVWTFSDAIPKLADSFTKLINGIDWEGANNTFRGLFGFLSSVLVGVAGTIVNIISKILPNLAPVINNTMKILRTLLDNVLQPLWNFISTNLLPIIEDVASAFGGAYLTAVSSVLEIMGNFADKLSQNVSPVLEYLSETVLPDLKSGFEVLQEILSPIVDVFSNILSSAINEYVNPALEFLSGEVLPKVGKTLKNLWENVLVPFGEFLSDVLKPVVDVVADVFDALWKNIIKPLANSIGTTLKNAFDGLYKILNQTVIPILKTVITVAKKIWDNVLGPLVKHLKDILKPAFDNVFSTIKNIINGVSTTLNGVIKFITGAFTGDWEDAWNGLKDIFKGVWDTLTSVLKAPINGVLSIFEGLANKIVDAWNWIKKQLNKVSIDIPDWVPGVGGEKFGFDLEMSEHIKIPRFATGGFPEDGLFMANHSELVGNFSNGRTAVANNQQITDGIAQAVAPAVYAAVKAAINEQAGNGRQIVINLDGRKIAESTIDQIGIMTRQRGKNPVLRYT